MALAVLLCCSCAGFDGEVFHARYDREDDRPTGSKLPCAALAGVDVSDSRTAERIAYRGNAGHVVGERIHEGNHRVRDRIAMIGLPTKWLGEALDSQLEAAGIPRQGGAAKLSVTLLSVALKEVFRISANYTSHVAIGVKLTAPDGTVCFQNGFTGDGENMGMQKSQRNMAQTANRALDEALARLLDDLRFREAACACGH